MTATLPARVKALRDRLATLDELGANVEEAGLLEDLRSDLAAPAAELSRALDQRQLLVDAGIEAPAPTSLDAARKRAVALLEKFTAERKAATLKKGAGWANMIKDMKAASGDVGVSAGRSWRAYRQIVFTGEPPSVIKGRIAFTPGNDAAFRQYEQLYRDFHPAFEKLPVDRAAIERVRALAAKLTETAKFFDYDVPQEVKAFLEAVQGGGATLELLTDTVKAWLKANHAFDTYRILPRSADGRR